jgi:N-acetylneuraminate synthase/N,N'-diacetyllegionaminate synthase
VSEVHEIMIGDRQVGGNQPCFIIAEIGINHNGNLKTAIEMIEVAAAAGVDCVKFQAFKAENFCSGTDDEFEYRSQGETVRESMLELFSRHEFNADQFRQLFAHARALGVIPMATPCDYGSVDLLDDLDAPAFKIGSDDLVYPDLLAYVAKKQKPLIISAGMADEVEIDRAVETIRSTGNEQIVILHCVSVYPTPADQLNLNKITTLTEKYDFPIGFSDHSAGITAALGARALGASVLEKHFTLDCTMPGPDHWFSSDPQELRDLVKQVRLLEDGLGSGALAPSAGEIEMRLLARRSIVAAHELAENHLITDEDLDFLRPGTGLMPYESASVIGRKTRNIIPAGTRLHPDMLE